MLAERRLRPLFRVEAFEVRIVSESELREAAPDLESLVDCNTPETELRALRATGLG